MDTPGRDKNKKFNKIQLEYEFRQSNKRIDRSSLKIVPRFYYQEQT